jgi:glycosyltransferase involved in cell wall biosynthesis
MNKVFTQPLVTVYMPTHNRANLVSRAIDSVLSQSYKNIELIVVDDGSTDSTYESLKGYILSGQIVYLKNNEPKGAPYSRNMAIKHASGVLITGLDDDDYFKENRILELVRAWGEREEKCVGLYTDCRVVNEDFTIAEKTNYPKKTTLESLYLRNSIGNQIFTSKKILIKSGGFDINLTCLQDLDAWINILFNNESCYLTKVNSGSYVLDKSHEHERISTGKIEKYIKSATYISKKYKLSFISSSRLMMQAYLYSPRRINFSVFLLSAVRSCSFYVFFRSIRNYMINKKNL